jgi:hypothetical protein
MAGCVQGTCPHLERECHTPFFRIWCGAHQLDLDELETIRNIDVFTVDTTINNVRNSELIVATISLKQIDDFWQSTKKAFPISPRIV